jgi:hypothetical protein
MESASVSHHARPSLPGSTRALRAFAHFISVVFHPLLISAYVIAFLIYLHPAAFIGMDGHTKLLRMISTILFTVFYPAFIIFIASRLRLIRSLRMDTRQDRIVGFIITMFFYWWTWNVFRNLPDMPPVAVHFTLGAFLAICIGWMCNIFFKISLHALAMGGLCAFFVIYGLNDPFASGLYLSIAVLITGLVCTSRLILGEHVPFEILSGLLMGILGQLAGWLF